MPKSAPEKVATSPNPMSRLSDISPCGSMYVPQKRSIIPPMASIAAVIICKLKFFMVFRIAVQK